MEVLSDTVPGLVPVLVMSIGWVRHGLQRLMRNSARLNDGGVPHER